MKKKPVQSKGITQKINPFDFSAWNFVIFLTLAFILIVAVAITVGGQAKSLSARAGLSCPEITTLPRPEDCPGGEWKFKRDGNGCRAFFCEAVTN